MIRALIQLSIIAVGHIQSLKHLSLLTKPYQIFNSYIDNYKADFDFSYKDLALRDCIDVVKKSERQATLAFDSLLSVEKRFIVEVSEGKSETSQKYKAPFSNLNHLNKLAVLMRKF